MFSNALGPTLVFNTFLSVSTNKHKRLETSKKHCFGANLYHFIVQSRDIIVGQNIQLMRVHIGSTFAP